MPTRDDRNLLFGILAHQNAFVTRDQLIAAMQVWLRDKSRALADMLREQGALDVPQCTLLDALVDLHIRQHDGDVQKSLQAVARESPVRHDLDQLPDTEVHASLMQHSSWQAVDALAPTLQPAPSFGQLQQDNELASRLKKHADDPNSGGMRFLVLRAHARGGLGVVHVALDTELQREVALKEIHGGLANNPDSRARFLLEAQITGGLEHPSIVPVYGLGSYPDGRPFYAMRLIRGDSLMDAIKRHHANKHATGAATELHKLVRRLVDVCNALQYAHDRGVLHRDIKPDNIMLGKYGETLVVDWGLAKLMGKPDEPAAVSSDAEPALSPSNPGSSAETQAGNAIGTPAFTPPEQAVGRLDRVGPASDVYSVGATLYCMLTGHPPATGATVEVLAKVRAGDIPAPRALDARIDPALEAVCLKAMALEPEDRYGSPRALADDLERWLMGTPVLAWPEPVRIKLRRWVGRHRTLVASAAALLLAAIPLLAILVVLSEDARHDLAREQKRTKEALKTAQRREAESEKARLDLARAQKKTGEALLVAERRQAEAEALGLRIQFEHYFSRAEERSDVALVGMANLLGKASRLKDPSLARSLRLHIGAWTRRPAVLRAVGAHQGPVVAVRLSADGKTALTGSSDRTARLWEVTTGVPRGPALQHDADVVAVDLGSDGKTALTATTDRKVQPWNPQTGNPKWQPLEYSHDIRCLALMPDGRHALIGCADGTATIRDLTSEKAPPLTKVSHLAEITAVALSADGKKALTASLDKSARLWNLATGKQIGGPFESRDVINAVALSADSRIALIASGHAAQLWDATLRKPIGPPLQHQAVIVAVALSADGAIALTGSADHTARLWDATTGAPIGTHLAHRDVVRSVSLSADGKTALTGSDDHMVRFWRVAGPFGGVPLAHQHDISALALSADGSIALTGSDDRTARLWDAAGKPIGSPLEHQKHVLAVVLTPDGKTALTASADQTVRAWDTTRGSAIGPPLLHPAEPRDIALSADGRIALTGCDDRKARLWRIGTSMLVGPPLTHPDAVRAVALSADGTMAITGSDDGTARLWRDGNPVGSPLKHADAIVKVALSADGKTALTQTESSVQRWNAATGAAIGPAFKSITTASLCSNGKSMLTGSSSRLARLWDTVTGLPLGPPLHHRGSIDAVALSGDGKIALTGSADQSARLWEVASGRPIGPPLPHPTRVTRAILSADGKVALTAGPDRTAWRWSVPQPTQDEPEQVLLWAQVVTGIEVDDLTAVHVLDARTWQERKDRLLKGKRGAAAD